VSAQPMVTPIGRTQLHDEVIGRLRSMILRCLISPGERINERILCEQLQISRTPLREALKVLAADGLVELLPNRGARIAPLSPTEVADSFEVLAILEKHAGELATGRLSESTIQDLYRLHQAMLAYSREGESESQLRVDLQIHRIIVAGAGNMALSSVHEGLARKVERARYLATIAPARVRQSAKEHEAILEAIMARDRAHAAGAFYIHCLKTRDAVVDALHRYLKLFGAYCGVGWVDFVPSGTNQTRSASAFRSYLVRDRLAPRSRWHLVG
jgi:DNA-binding GntR family transcriptional regulator